MFVTACECGNYAVCSILIKNLPSSDKISEIPLDAEVTNLVQIKVENPYILFFDVCGLFR
jgi:hypothetical protein